MLRLIPITAITLFAFASSGCGEAPRDAAPDKRTPISQASNAHPSVPVPDVVGLSETEAVKALGASGLVADVRYADDAPLTGKVLDSDPEAGSELAPNSVVVLSIALYRLPMPEPEDEQAPEAFGRLLEDNPKVFFGTYLAETGTRVVVFGPGADPAEWRDRLTAALEGRPFRTGSCSRTRASLRAIQDDIAIKDWTENKQLGFTVGVDNRTCTVRVGSDLLTPADIAALIDRYGTSISFNTSEALVLAHLVD